ncbi:metal ABC transporter permease [Candidatus Dependentiae bacterium]
MNTDIILSKQILYALVTSAFVGGVAGYIGSLMVTKRMALMAGALGHLTLPGIALAIAYGFDVTLGALIILIFGVFAIWAIERKTKLPTESATAIVFATSLAIALLFLKHEEIDIALIGDISKITLLITIATVMLSLAIFIIIRKIMPALALSSISQDLATVEGIPVAAYRFMYLACIALVVAMGVRIVGGLMTAALVAIPAATSKNVSKNLFQYTFFSLLFGAASCILGVLVSYFTNLPAGPMIILCSSLFFALSLFMKKS